MVAGCAQKLHHADWPVASQSEASLGFFTCSCWVMLSLASSSQARIMVTYLQLSPRSLCRWGRKEPRQRPTWVHVCSWVVQGRADDYRVYHRVIPVASPAARGPPLALGPSPAPACDRSLSRAPYLPAPQPPGPLLPPSLLDRFSPQPQEGGTRIHFTRQEARTRWIQHSCW